MAMTEVETELDSRYDDIDVDSILARCQKGPITYSKRCLYSAPEFVKRLPSSEEVEEGSTVTFGCQVVGFPNPSVTWYKEDDVITADARAVIDADETDGYHSIRISDVSKCDAGIYKIRASNLEGSSTSMLYIAVKARSKLRNRKKTKRSRHVACPPLFPAIIERVAEEQKEMLEIELQPESPLTPIYCTISRKEPVNWPAFLGDWAYHSDDMLHRDEIDDSDGVEDVFDDDDDVVTPTSLTFVSTAYAQMMHNVDNDDDEDIESVDKAVLNQTDRLQEQSKSVDNTVNGIHHTPGKTNKNADSLDSGFRSDDEEIIEIIEDNSGAITPLKENHCDKMNNNDNLKDKHIDKNKFDDDETRDSLSELKQFSHDSNNHQTDAKESFVDPETVSVICVHRSYAKGDSTSSVARRSPSPLSRSRNPMTFNKNSQNCDMNGYSDTTTLQNMNNERILQNMYKNMPLSHRCLAYMQSLASASTWEDHVIELFVLICGSTFLALYFDISPSTFVVNILIALFIKLVLTELLNDSS